jgi:DNA mismatch repair protein MutS
MVTPARQQYLDIKRQYPHAIVLYRLGDFYEMFDEDARIGAQVLNITLTSRSFGKNCRVPMAGIPYHALNSYLARLLAKGFKVAIVEQLSEPGRGLIERGVVRVVTPGTVAEPGLLRQRENTYLAAVVAGRGGIGLAYVDVSTGEFAATQASGVEAPQQIATELQRLEPAECLVPEGQEQLLPVVGHVTTLEPWRFDPDAAGEALRRQFGVASLEGFGCADLPLAQAAAAAILAYVEQNNRALLAQLISLRTYSVTGSMPLDAGTRRNLELLANARGRGLKGSLLGTLDRTRTPMGGRLLRRWISQPLLDRAAIERRLDTVDELYQNSTLRGRVLHELGKLGDLERLAGRVQQGTASVREVWTLHAALGMIERLREALGGVASAELREIAAALDPCREVAALIERAVALPESGRMIRPGYDAALDELESSVKEARHWIAGLERAERERTGIRSLKVGYNKVFGYYIEVTKPNLPLVPPEYERKQTVAGAERFVTPELKAREAQIAAADERIATLERELFERVLRQIGCAYPRLRGAAEAAARLDVYAALAETAALQRYVRPQLHDGDEIEIVAGRHPVIEAELPDEPFVPNDCTLNCHDRQILIVTGPNMAGKSTYLRQVALIVLMAQIGSFVPAERARIGLVDRIFTRIGAQDDLAAGASTFMVEMAETANILRHATSRSLVVLDEVGRGTSTHDGVAIARAVVEYLHDVVGARTLFATHYQELTSLADELPRVHNLNVAVAEQDGRVIFLHRIVPGSADRSYGIHVAELAGLPARVTERARAVLGELERAQECGTCRCKRQMCEQPERSVSGSGANGALYLAQLPLFEDEPPPTRAERVLADLLALDLSRLTPLEALQVLAELQARGRGA